MKFIKNQNAISENLSEKTFILNNETGMYIELNETASELWNSFENESNSDELTNHLIKEYEIDEGVAKTDVDEFIKWYKLIMKIHYENPFSKKIKIINYENFILNHKKEKKKLLKFLGIKEDLDNKFNLSKSEKNIFKAKKNLSKIELKKISFHLKKYLKWPKFVDKI